MREHTASSEEHLTSAELAIRTNTLKGLWDKLRQTGGGPPYIKLGRKVLYRWSDVEPWLDARRRRSTSDEGRTPISNAA